MVDERVHGLRDARYSCEHDAPCVGAVESAGGGDGDGAEQDGCCEGYESNVSAGDVFLECLHRCLKWPGFCSDFIARRLTPLDSYNTRFPPLPVSCSPGTGAAVSRSTTRPTGTSPAPGPSDHGRACAARRARSCTRRRRILTWRCRRSRRQCRSTAACHIPSPWWCTPC